MLRACRRLWAPVSPEFVYGALAQRGTSAFFGVPDPALQSFTAYLADHAGPERHVITAMEGHALAMAAGHYLATGSPACVYLQNSGLGNLVNPALSLTHAAVFQLPALLLVGWRGRPGAEVPPPPPHSVQGRLTEALLDACEMPYAVLSRADGDAAAPDASPDASEAALEAVLDRAYAHLREKGTPFALLVEPGAVGPYAARPMEGGASDLPFTLTREAALEQVVRQLDEGDVVVSSGGAAARELFEIRQRAGQGHQRDFLSVGSMGHGSSVASGIALARPARRVFCIDGDGSALMHMGALATQGGLAACKDADTGTGPLSNFKHVVLNNGAHESAGGQPTVAFDVSLTGVARECGYHVVRPDPVLDEGELVAAMRDLKACDGPAFLEVLVAKGCREDLGWPSRSLHENKADFMGYLRTE